MYSVNQLTPGGNGCLSNTAEGWLNAGVATGDGEDIFCSWLVPGFVCVGLLLPSTPAIISLILFTATENEIQLCEIYVYSEQPTLITK